MHHRMFKLRDIPFVGIILGIIGLTIAAIVWNLVADDGEPIPIAGWVSASGAVAAGLAILIIYYVQRWLFVRTYAYTVRGVEYFYRDGCEKYLIVRVEEDIEQMLAKWLRYYRDKGVDPHLHGAIAEGAFIEGAVCVFRPEEKWEHVQPGLWTRLVTGLTWGSWVMVGQGGRPIERTAHAHELSHVHMNLYEGRYVGEEESHAVFKEVGV